MSSLSTLFSAAEEVERAAPKLTAYEEHIIANWKSSIAQLKVEGILPPEFEIPNIEFEEENMYMPNRPPELNPEVYQMLEKIFDDVIVPLFNDYKFTDEFVLKCITSIQLSYIYEPRMQPVVLGKNEYNCIVIRNEDEIEQFLDDIDPRIKDYANMIYDKIHTIIEYYNSQFLDYDIIIYINTHGEIEGRLSEMPLLPIDPTNNVRFIAYAQLGEKSFALFDELYMYIKGLFEGHSSRVIDIKEILHALHRKKLEMSFKQKQLNARTHKDQFSRQQVNEGWNVYSKCIEREYTPDPTFVPRGYRYHPFEVLYDPSRKLLGQNLFELLHQGTGKVKRSQLLKHVFDAGYRNPLYIDVSCAISKDPRLTHADLRALRAARRAMLPSAVNRDGVCGGKRKSRKKSKSRKCSRKNK